MWRNLKTRDLGHMFLVCDCLGCKLNARGQSQTDCVWPNWSGLCIHKERLVIGILTRKIKWYCLWAPKSSFKMLNFLGRSSYLLFIWSSKLFLQNQFWVILFKYMPSLCFQGSRIVDVCYWFDSPILAHVPKGKKMHKTLDPKMPISQLWACQVVERYYSYDL